jgi:hypothetical protein
MSCGCRGIGAGQAAPTAEQFAGATYSDADGRVCWKPEVIATILGVLSASSCVQPPQPETDPRTFSMQRAGTEGMPSVGCEPALAAELADPSRRAFVTYQAVWPYDPFISVTTMPVGWGHGMYGSSEMGAYLPPGVGASAVEQPPLQGRIVPVWKQALMLGGLGLGIVGVIWFARRKGR